MVTFLAGIGAQLLAPGPNNATGFVLTTAHGMAGALPALS
jgi:uncharacterized membrane protein YeaQ/YmgE (transglycosylase-associated protein family)